MELIRLWLDTFVLEFVHCCGLYGTVGMMWFLIDIRTCIFAGITQSGGIDPYMVITHSCGNQGAFGYWVYPMGDGSAGYLQPVWMAVQ